MSLRKLTGCLFLAAAIGCTREAAVSPQESGSAAPARSAAAAEATGELQVGDPMRNFEVTNIDGTPFTFAEMKGKPVLLNLWATWCGPCRAEIPELQRLHEEHEADGFAVLGVSVDEPGAKQEIESFLAERNVTYPNVHDPEAKVADMFNAFALPTSVLIDRNGTVVWKKIGIIRFEDPELRKAMATVMSASAG